MTEREAFLKARNDPTNCARCQAGQGITKPGPKHQPSDPTHAPHCSCDGCY